MKRLLKWAGIVIGSIVLLLLIIGLTIFVNGNSKIGKTYAVDHTFDAGTADSTKLARGEHLVRAVSKCVGCHGDNLGGYVLVDDAAFGKIVSPNLTSGRDGVGGEYNDSDWERAIRHGVARDGRLLVGMPSEYFTYMGDADLAAIVTYVKQLPPTDSDLPETAFGPMAKLLIGAGMYKPPAIALEHAAEHMIPPNPAISVEYGEYMVRISTCSECHGAALKGPEFEGPPPGPDLTSTGNLSSWTEEDFLLALRSGTTPDGRVLDSEQMPWPLLSRMTELELKSIWAFLQTL